jgi:hypothetical protein
MGTLNGLLIGAMFAAISARIWAGNKHIQHDFNMHVLALFRPVHSTGCFPTQAQILFFPRTDQRAGEPEAKAALADDTAV